MLRTSHTLNRRVRIIAAVLLAAIAWASTAEFTHRHNVRVVAAPTAETQTVQTNLSVEQTSDAIQNGQPARSSSRANLASECLICQLHHNLATTILSEPASVTTPQLVAAHATLLTHVHLLDFTTAQSGRAPPLPFLS